MAIHAQINHGVATIEIARPDKKNALTQAMYRSMAEALAAATADPAVRAVLLMGQPDVFTAGNDIEDFMRHGLGDTDLPVFDFMREMVACDKPIVAAVTGAAVGVGSTMLLHCDFVYLSEHARLVMPFVTLGLVPEFASSLLLPQLLGRVKAAEKLLLGEPIGPAEAVACGLANAVLPHADVLPHARRIAERFNDLPMGAVRDTKRLLNAAGRNAVRDSMRDEIAVFKERLNSAEAKEAFTAFFEKRRPDFTRC